MGVTKTGPPMVVDYLITRQLAGMPEFWAAVPAAVAEEFRTRAVEAAAGRGCGGCTSLRAAMTPVHNALWDRLAAEPDLEAVGAVVAAKRGYRPRPVAVYYVDGSGETRVLTI